MPYYKRVVKKRPASLTDQEMEELLQAARLHAADLAKANAIWREPVLVTRVLCWWCRKYHSPAEVETCMAVKRPVGPESGNGTLSSSAKMGSLLAAYSHIWEFLSETRYSDGKPRQPGTLSLRVGSSGVQITLTDPSAAVYCSLTGETADDVLLALEVGLDDGSLHWRTSTFNNKRK